MTWDEMIDLLMDEDPVIQEKLAKVAEKAKAEAKAEWEAKLEAVLDQKKGFKTTAVNMTLLLVEDRFPRLTNLAVRRLREARSSEVVIIFLAKLISVHDEESARHLLHDLKRQALRSRHSIS